LLTNEDDERRAIHACRCERADGVSESGGRMEDGERRLVARDRVARRKCYDGALVQREHERQVVGESCEERHLRRAGVREQRRQAATTEHVERRVPDCPGQPQTSCATSTIKRSFAHCSSSVRTLPSTVDENPHCGERQ